jgi:hypothetical protein
MTILTTLLAVLYVALPALIGLYSFWFSSKKDGFNQEKVFDLVLYGLLGGLGVGSLVDVLSRGQLGVDLRNLNPYVTLFGFIATCSLVALSYKWSVYRVLDNLATSCVVVLAFWLVAECVRSQFRLSYLLAAGALLAASYALWRYRPGFLRSGMEFSLVGGLFCLAALLFLPKDHNLIFVGLLFTLSVVILIFRLRSIYGKSKSTHSTSHNL